MSQHDLFLEAASSGSKTWSRSTPFRVYLTLGDSGVERQASVTGLNYYKTKGMGSCYSFYNQADAAAVNQANMQSRINAFYASYDFFSTCDLWFWDYEGTYYNFAVADAATCVADTNTLIGWANSYFSSKGVARPYLGVYTPNGGGGATKGPTSIATSYWIWSPSQRASWRADNAACGGIASAWDFLAPEIYTYRLDQFAMKAEIFCQEKAAVGGTAKLLPIFQPTQGGSSCTQAQMYNILKYAYSCPEMDGLILWSLLGPAPAAAPTYYDGQDWMKGALQFCNEFGITHGSPF